MELIEIERMSIDHTIVSASYVKKEIECGNIEELKNFVPICTYQYVRTL